MSVSGSKGMLTLASRELQARWQETRALWRDGKAREFEERYLSELPILLGAAFRAIDELDLLLDQLHADCD